MVDRSPAFLNNNCGQAVSLQRHCQELHAEQMAAEQEGGEVTEDEMACWGRQSAGHLSWQQEMHQTSCVHPHTAASAQMSSQLCLL